MNFSTLQNNQALVAVVPAAGVGKRMKSDTPKQYLKLHQLTILELTVNRLLAHPQIEKVYISLGETDEYFQHTSLSTNTQVETVVGGSERVDSVLAALKAIDSEEYPWVLVHDAARPCVNLDDISELINQCQVLQHGGLLATRVRDTMKRSNNHCQLKETVERENLWHALTPQMYPTDTLIAAIEQALDADATITDEASAIEFIHGVSALVEGSGDNIKITQPSDLALAEFILNKQQENA